MRVGDAVKFVDTHGIRHNALVTAVWGEGPLAALNLVYVLQDPGRQDQYGRQIERPSSVTSHAVTQAPGYFWAPDDAVVNEVIARTRGQVSS